METGEQAADAEIAPQDPKPGGARGVVKTASLGGAGAGTGLASIGEAIGPHTVWGAILIYVAPAATVGVGFLLAQTGDRLREWFERRNDEIDVANARKVLTPQLLDDSLSVEHKEYIRGLLEKVSRIQAEKAVSRVRRSDH